MDGQGVMVPIDLMSTVYSEIALRNRRGIIQEVPDIKRVMELVGSYVDSQQELLYKFYNPSPEDLIENKDEMANLKKIVKGLMTLG